MNTKGESILISPKLEDYRKQIIGDIKHYGDKTLDTYKPLKMAKRIWAIAVSIGDQKTLKKIYPLFSSGASILYQIDAEIETIIEVLSDMSIRKELIKDNSLEIIIKQIESFKSRITEIYDMELYEDLIFSIIDDIIESDINYYFIIKKLKQLSKILTDDFNEAGETYLKNVKLLNINYYDYLLED